MIDVEKGMAGESPLDNVSTDTEIIIGVNSPGIAVESRSKAAHHAPVSPLDTAGLTFEREAATVGETYTSHGTIRHGGSTRPRRGASMGIGGAG